MISHILSEFQGVVNAKLEPFVILNSGRHDRQLEVGGKSNHPNGYRDKQHRNRVDAAESGGVPDAVPLE